MKLVVLLGKGDVYATGGGRCFHEGADCAAMTDGQAIRMCRCGDQFCGCFGEMPPRPRRMSIGDAAMQGLKPCIICYPGFQEMVIQLPAEEDFGHQKIRLHDTWHCQRCVVRWREDDGTSSEHPKEWPCTSALVLGLV